jgi:hypothetical protein
LKPAKFQFTQIFILSAIACILSNSARADSSMQLTYPDLVEHLYNPEKVALLPLPGETAAQFSTYDRSSVYDEKTGYYLNWGANEDQSGCLRMEGENTVMAEMKGPGCIWRIWSADPHDGHVQIFLDGNPAPAVDLPFKDYFSGKVAPFNQPELVYTASRGFNNYTPISYQKSCKIVALPNWGAFYHFNYTTFPAGTKVPTFQTNLYGDDAAALKKANDVFARRGQPPYKFPSASILKQTISALPGENTSHILLSTSNLPNGGGSRPDGHGEAIVSLRVHVENLPTPGPERDKLLRELCLEITWDDETKPGVWAPLGDFFGVAPGSQPFQSLMSGLTVDGEFYSHWCMPYAKARFAIVNNSAKPQNISLEIGIATLSQPLEAYGRFHAKWHRDAFLNEELSRTIDWPILKTLGRGRYVGTQLHIWNARHGWWGEGDEKFFIDGEKFPSTFGTGSEDYFGYAWCDTDLFDRAFHGQSECSKDNTGNTNLHRWQLADNVPFQKSFDGGIEKYFSDRRPTLYAATAYWYLEPGGTDPYEPIPVADRIGYWNTATSPLMPEGVIDSDSMEVRHHTGGRVGIRVTDEYATKLGLAANRPLCLWVENKVGETLELKVHSMWYVPNPGRFHVIAHCVKASGMGIVQFYWNSAKAGAPVDLYSPNPEDVDVDLGVFDVVPQIQLLKFEITGANPAAKPLLGVAFDYLKLVPEK